MDRPIPPLELDQLLQHRRFLQSLVRGMLADEQGVEDVLQDTWLVALEKAPRGIGSIGAMRAWLGRVARNAALNRIRGERHRSDRVLATARPDRFETTGLDTDQKLERQNQVLQAVMRLKEPRRTAIHLRYFEDLEPARIAEKLGVSVNTVNDRLRQGREELRRDLERTLGVDLHGGILGFYLLPLAGLSESARVALEAQLAAAAATAGAATSTVTVPNVVGGLLMSKQVLVLTAVVLVASVLWTVSRSEPAAAEVVEPPTLSGAAESVPAVAEAIDRSRKPDAPAVATVERESVPAALAVEGVVYGRDDVPLGDVALRLVLWGGYEPEGEPLREERLTADDDGRFRWETERPAGAFVVWAHPADDRYVGYGDESRVLEDEKPETLAVRVYPIDVTVTGYVRDEHGAPIAGATVNADETVTTDHRGRYFLAAAANAPGYVTAVADGFARKRAAIAWAPNGETRLDFELRPEFRITGRVTDESGAPLEGVLVATFYSMRHGVRTDARGDYELGHLDPGRDQHSLFARREGFTEASAVVRMTPELHAEQDLVMRTGCRITGLVVDEDDAPLPGARLYLGFSPNAYNRIDASADDEGRFVFENAPTGAQTIGTHREGYAPDVTTHQIPRDADTFEVKVVLREGRTLAGWVFDEDSSPVSGVRVQARYKGDWISLREETDAEGRFELTGVPATEVALSFYEPSFVRHRLPIPDGDVEELEVALARSGKVGGRVVDAITGEPLSEFKIRLLPADACGEGPFVGLSATWVREGQSFSGSNGYWDSGDEILPPGGYVGVEASAPGYAPVVEPCVLIGRDFDRDGLVLSLSGGLRIEGRVRDLVTGEPLEGAIVRRSRSNVILSHASPHEVELTTTDAYGEFTLDDVPPGELSLTIEHADHPRTYQDGPFQVSGGAGVVHREIEIGGAGQVTGLVRDADGRALAGARVRLEGEARGVVHDLELTTESDSNGSFAFRDLPDGTYAISRDPGDEPVAAYSAIVRIQDGRSCQVELEPPQGPASIDAVLQSTVELPAALPVTLLWLPESGLASTESLSSFGVVARDGLFRLENLPAGKYYARIAFQDEATHTLWRGGAELTLGAGAATPVVIPVEPDRR